MSRSGTKKLAGFAVVTSTEPLMPATWKTISMSLVTAWQNDGSVRSPRTYSAAGLGVSRSSDATRTDAPASVSTSTI